VRFDAATLGSHGIAVDTGFSDFVELSDRLCAQVLNARLNQVAATRYPGEDWLKLECWVSGRVSLVFRRFGQIDFRGRWCFAHLHRDEIVKGEWVDPREPCISATIYCKPEYIEEALGSDVERLPASLRDFVGGKPPTSLFAKLPLGPDVARAVCSLANTFYTGSLRRLYVEAKVVELLTGAMDTLCRGGNARDPVVHLTQTEKRRIAEVRDLLVASCFSRPPLVADLARHAAMNQQKLQRGFKQIYGQTIMDFCQEERLERAREMLENGELTVTQIALTVGYDFANNFSSAFKRHFGVTPNAYRQSCRRGPPSTSRGE